MRLIPFARPYLPILPALAAVFFAGTAARADVKIVSELNVTGLPQSQTRQKFPQSVTTFYKGDKSRTELGNKVTIYDAATDKLYTLDPANKTYTAMTPQEASQKGAGLLALLKVDVTADVKEGETIKTIAGKQARSQTFTATIGLGFEGSPTGSLARVKIEGEQWATDAVMLSAAAQRVAAAGFAQSLGPLVQNAKPLTDKLATLKGTPLSRRVVATVTSDQELPGLPDGPVVATLDARSVSEGPLDDALFAVPADYKLAETPPPAAPALPGS